MSTVEENKAPQQPAEIDLANAPLKNAESDGKRVRTEEAGSPMDEVSDESPPKKTKRHETVSSARFEKADNEAASAAEPDSTTGGDATNDSNVEEKADDANDEANDESPTNKPKLTAILPGTNWRLDAPVFVNFATRHTDGATALIKTSPDPIVLLQAQADVVAYYGELALLTKATCNENINRYAQRLQAKQDIEQLQQTLDTIDRGIQDGAAKEVKIAKECADARAANLLYDLALDNVYSEESLRAKIHVEMQAAQQAAMSREAQLQEEMAMMADLQRQTAACQARFNAIMAPAPAAELTVTG